MADVLGANGYPEHIIKSAVRPRRVLSIKEAFCIATAEYQKSLNRDHCCDAGNNSVLLDNQLYFVECIFSAPSASGLLHSPMKATVWYPKRQCHILFIRWSRGVITKYLGKEGFVIYFNKNVLVM